MSQLLTFQSTTFDIIDQNGQPWIQSRQLATALGYKDERSVHKIYERNKEEFTESMVSVVNLTTPGNLPIQARIFSLRGCHLIAMFARTQIAKAFRVWVLDVLETLNQVEQRPALESTTTPSTADDRAPLRALVHAWAQVSGKSHTALWPQVKAHFQLSRIDDLPVEWIPDALSFVQGKIDEAATVGALPEPLNHTQTALAIPGAADLENIHFQVKASIREIRSALGRMYDIEHKAVKARMGAEGNTRAILLNNHNAMGKSLDVVEQALDGISANLRVTMIAASL